MQAILALEDGRIFRGQAKMSNTRGTSLASTTALIQSVSSISSIKA